MPDLQTLLDSIKGVSSGGEVIIALSGGLDSSLVFFLSVLAWGKERVIPVHVDWGIYTYGGIPEKVRMLCSGFDLEPVFISGQSALEGVLKKGPACNRCTRKAKLGLIRSLFPNSLIVTGANQSDSWGSRGKSLINNVYAPLFPLTKAEVKDLAKELGLFVAPIGESSVREGCKAKHLLKPLVSHEFHGEAVSMANELLLNFLKKAKMEAQLANVKIVGPLSTNIAVVNVLPYFDQETKGELKETLKKTNLLNKIIFADSPLRLTIVCNPAIYNDTHAQAAIKDGILSPSFSAPLECRWIKSENKRLYSFHVVAVEKL